MTTRACPLCAAVTDEPYCPECGKKRLFVATLTLAQLEDWLCRSDAGASMVRRAIEALKERRKVEA